MPREEDFSFSFVSQALAEDTFTVAELKGMEGISSLYEFDILLYAEDPEIDLKAVLKSPATLTIIPEGDEERKIHGIPASFEQLQEYDEYIFYRLKLVPRLWLADQYHENMLFLEKSVPDIIEEILSQVGLSSDDYELRLTGSYQPWEYICQYNETDFDFMSRWMEREGIYYYFDQSGDIEKLIITDSSTAHQPIEGGAVIYSPPGVVTPAILEQIKEFTCRQQILPKKVILKDYNYRRPSLDLKGEADVDSEGRGNVYIYGEHFKTPEEGNALARIRAEELLCREAVFYGDGTVSPLLPGYIFELDEHYRDSYNQRYLVTDIRHHGVQSEYLAMAAGITRLTDLDTPSYNNQFSCMPENVQYRPTRKTTKPRIDGTLNAKVDAAGDGQYAEIDDEGRYKIKLPFDQSQAAEGKASRWVRMAQPYAGADYGMHFPLHRGVEVLLTFIDGDPDRPIIAGSVPNPETMSPIISESQTKTMIRTGGGNQIHTEDQDGGQLLKLYSPTAKSSLRLGAPNPGGNHGVMIFTEADEHVIVQGHRELSVDKDNKETISGKETVMVSKDRKKTVKGKEKNFIDSRQESYIKGGRVMQVSTGGDTTTIYDGQNHTVHGAKESTVHGNETTTVHGNRNVTVDAVLTTRTLTESHTVTGARTITVDGAQTRNIGSETSIHKVAQDEIKTGNYISVYSGAYADNKFAAAFENYIGIKLELKASVGIEIAGIKLGFTDVNISQDFLTMKKGKLVLGDHAYINFSTIKLLN